MWKILRFELKSNVKWVETSETKKTAAVYRIDKNKSERTFGHMGKQSKETVYLFEFDIGHGSEHWSSKRKAISLTPTAPLSWCYNSW